MRLRDVDLNDDVLESRLNSYQFKLSLDILGKRIGLNLTRRQVARLTGLTENEYTQIEQGIDLKSSKERYQDVLDKLGNLKVDSE